MSCRRSSLLGLGAVLLASAACGGDGAAAPEARTDALSSEVVAALLLPTGHHAQAVHVDDEGAVFVGGTFTEASDGTVAGFLARIRDGALEEVTYWSDATPTGGGTTVEDVATAADGSVFVAGFSAASQLPTTAGSFQPDRPIAPSAYVLKLGAEDMEVIWGSWLGGGLPEPREGYGPLGVTVPTGLVVDEADRPHVTGYTGAPDFPTTPGALQETRGGCGTRICPQVAFVTAFSADGSRLAFSTIFGGAADTYPEALDLDGAGRDWVVGDAPARQFFGGPQLRDGFPVRPGDWETWPDDAFLARIDDEGSTLGLALYLGAAAAAPGSGGARDVAVRGPDVLVVGTADATDFATAGAALTEHTGYFAAAYSLEGEKQWATFLAAGPQAVASLPESRVGVVGSTGDGLSEEAYLGVLAPDASALEVTVQIGGQASDRATDLCVAADGTVWVVGDTDSADFAYGDPPAEGVGAFVLQAEIVDEGDGETDAGEPDAGEPDAGEPDAGEPDAGEPDAGEPDAGEADAGTDGGVPVAPDAESGCGCTGTGPSGLEWALLLALLPVGRTAPGLSATAWIRGRLRGSGRRPRPPQGGPPEVGGST